MTDDTETGRFFILSLLVLLVAGVGGQFREWSPPGVHYPGLACPERCFVGNETTTADCCLCNSKAPWEVGLSPEPVPLFIEYSDITGYLSYVVTQTNDTASNMTKVEHSHGRLRAIPQNICQFSTLVSMVLDNNEIQMVSNITCLMEIEIIDLSYNNIKAISNDTFNFMMRLRYLNLTNNPLKTLEPNSLQGKERSLLSIDLSFGKMESLDYSNFIFEKSFCTVIFDGNPISEFTNSRQLTIDTNKVYGEGALVSLVDCELIQMVNYSELGIGKKDFPKYLQFTIDTSGSNLVCDCIMAEFFGASIQALEKHWVSLTRDHNKNMTCLQPESLRGVPFVNLFNQIYRDKMICEEPENCPRDCHCYSQPSRDHLVVNCTEADLRQLPESLPYGLRYSLLFDGNVLDALDNRDYLDRVYFADFSNNPLQTITEDAITTLQDDVKVVITESKLKSLPIAFSRKYPNQIILGTLSIECSCDDAWISIWQKRNGINISSTVLCANYGGINILDMTSDVLGCDTTTDIWKYLSISLSSVLSFAIGASLLFLCYRPEIFLLYRHRLLCRKHDFSYSFDVYVCFEEDNELIRKWVVRDLLSFLQTKGYRVHIPCIDEIPGCIGLNSRKSAIDNSRAYVTILTNNSFKSDDQHDKTDASQFVRSENVFFALEFSHIWSNFKQNRLKRLVVINFDNTCVNETTNRYIQAFLRTREAVDFTNRHDKIFETLEKKIGPPKPPNSHLNKKGFPLSISTPVRL